MFLSSHWHWKQTSDVSPAMRSLVFHRSRVFLQNNISLKVRYQLLKKNYFTALALQDPPWRLDGGVLSRSACLQPILTAPRRYFSAHLPRPTIFLSPTWCSQSFLPVSIHLSASPIPIHLFPLFISPSVAWALPTFASFCNQPCIRSFPLFPVWPPVSAPMCGLMLHRLQFISLDLHKLHKPVRLSSHWFAKRFITWSFVQHYSLATSTAEVMVFSFFFLLDPLFHVLCIFPLFLQPAFCYMLPVPACYLVHPSAL